tara:strand:+ start:3935 stop:4246 length:312 start_codon:yes stop_codon:yes gene_type:complete
MENMMNPQMGMNEELETLSSQDMDEAKAAMGELINMIAEMKAAGMSDEEINKFLSEFGLTLEEVLMADQALKNPEMLQDPSMMGGQPEMAQDNQIQAQLDELM